MSEPFLSEIKMMSFNYPPKGWALCNGQTVSIAQNQALFSLLGTTFGGNGTTNFMLPNLQGRVPNHTGGIGHFLGQTGGEQAHTLSVSELPTHIHLANAANVVPAAGNPATTRMLSQSQGSVLYAAATNLQPFDPQAISTVGGSQPHLNMQPFLTISFCIALQGIFPSRN